MREVAWTSLSVAPERISDGAFARVLSAESPQAARLAVLGLDYFCRASRIPREFNLTLTNQLLDAQMK